MNTNPCDASGKVTLVTGGNSGIGLGFARGAARAGGDIVIWGRRAESNQAAAEELLGADRGAVVVVDPRNGDILALASAPGYNPNDFATGGTVTANQPTNLIFGEGGPEMATLTPLTRPQSTRNMVRGTRDGRGGQGKTQIEVILSPDLIGRVINQTQQQVAEVFIENTKRG